MSWSMSSVQLFQTKYPQKTEEFQKLQEFGKMYNGNNNYSTDKEMSIVTKVISICSSKNCRCLGMAKYISLLAGVVKHSATVGALNSLIILSCANLNSNQLTFYQILSNTNANPIDPELKSKKNDTKIT